MWMPCGGNLTLLSQRSVLSTRLSDLPPPRTTLPFLPLAQIPKPNLQSLRLPEPSPEIRRMVRLERSPSHASLAACCGNVQVCMVCMPLAGASSLACGVE